MIKNKKANVARTKIISKLVDCSARIFIKVQFPAFVTVGRCSRIISSTARSRNIPIIQDPASVRHPNNILPETSPDPKFFITSKIFVGSLYQ